MPSQLYQQKRQGWLLQRSASGGAAITLMCGCGRYTANFECASRISSVLGEHDLQNLGDEKEPIPTYRIPFEEMSAAVQKLRTRFSVALIDLAMAESGSRFVLIARIDPVNGNGAVSKPVTMEDF